MEMYEKMEQDVCEFKKYAKMTLDLMTDSYKWLKLSEYAEDLESKEKYKSVSDTLFNMFLIEHNNIGKMFKGE